MYIDVNVQNLKSCLAYDKASSVQELLSELKMSPNLSILASIVTTIHVAWQLAISSD